MDDSNKIDKLMLETFAERLKFDVLQHHVILYADQCGFEYNYQTNRIRPFNAILWYPLDEFAFEPFISYLKSEIEKEIDIFEAIGYSGENPSIGLCIDGYFVIELTDMFDWAPVTDDKYTVKELIDSYHDFVKYIDHLYCENITIFRDIIKKQQGSLF